MKKIIWFFFVLLTMAVFAYAQTSQRGTMGTSDDRYINIYNENDIFELDTSGDVMPSASGKISAYFEEDGIGNIQPKDQDCFDQDSSGDYEPIQ